MRISSCLTRYLAVRLCFPLLALLATGAGAQPVKIAFIDPLSGPGAAIGEHGLKHLRQMAETINAKGGLAGGRLLEVVAYDNKGNPQDSLAQLQKAIDAGVRYISQGEGSGVAAAISEFVAKYNDRNPGKEVLYFNHSAVDPALTNEKCSFWHFRFDANSDIKMAALTNFIKTRPDVQKVYIIGQDYAFGHAVRRAANTMLKDKRPDIRIVGDELHPILRVTDFTPYIAKIKASGADSVITGNWGDDMRLLLKAAGDSGLKVNWFTYNGAGGGSPTAAKQAGVEQRLFQISEWHANVPSAPMESFADAFRSKHGGAAGLGWWYLRVRNQMEMFAAAAEKAKSVEPKAVARALEGMRFTNVLGAEMLMRADDHSAFQDLYISSFGPGVARDEEKTGWGWKTVAVVKAADTVLPTACKMKRPAFQ